MMNNNNPFVFGSMAYLNLEASKVPDILYLIQPDMEIPGDYCLKIICRPGYDIDSILEWAYETLPAYMDYEIIVEENYQKIKRSTNIIKKN